ncbi:MAG: phenylalanine--tRNA ligase subunit beta [Elusimicrobiota bacterium]|jgi:phenylalanyl-tRNA synthetase beta chain
MKISHRWLSEFLPVPLSPDELLRMLPSLGFDVDSMEALGPAFSGVVIGHVLEVQKHPNADRLSLCRVSDGKEIYSVVCGAPNVAQGQRVPFALPGAKLPGGFLISKTKIRGVESLGMLCSTSELGLSGEASGILVLDEAVPVGADAAALLAEKDTVFEVEVTANRPDCLSVFGLAREIGVHLRKSLPPPRRAAVAEDASVRTRPVEIAEPELCGRYIGREFKNLRVGASPGWLARRLESVGQKPINALVDITNYALFEYGHPLHVFDTATLKGEKLFVRRARAQEKLPALDGKTYELQNSDLVIADESGPVALAGVMGSMPTGSTNKTTACFLEAAHFKPGSVRATSRRLGLRSESSYRFERGTDPECAALASARASELIMRLCGKPSAGAAVDAYPGRRETPSIRLNAADINRVLGTSLDNAQLRPLLSSLSERLEDSAEGWVLHPPSWRPDLCILQDVAEEVARHIGYDAIPDAPAPAALPAHPEPAIVKTCSTARALMAAQGFFEAVNYDLSSEAALAWCERGALRSAQIGNPLSDEQARLRTSLWPALLRAAAHNVDRGAQNLRLFEIGRVYALGEDGKSVQEKTFLSALFLGESLARPHWRDKTRPADFYDAKGLLELLLPASQAPMPCEGGSIFHPKACVGASLNGAAMSWAGSLDPRLLAAFDLTGRPAAGLTVDLDALAELAGKAERRSPAAVSPFPSVVRDLSLLFPRTRSYGEIATALHGLSIAMLSRVELVDVFTGKGIAPEDRSLTLRLSFSSLERTLTDAEVAASMEKALALLQTELGGRLR